MTKAPTLVWDRCSRTTWDDLLTRAGQSPIEQSWAYGEALKGTTARRGVVDADGDTVAMVQMFERRILSRARLAQIIRGPVWLTDEPDHRVFAMIKKTFQLRAGTLLVWMPELVDHPDSIAAMRNAGLRRMTTGYSSAWVDLTRPADELRRTLHGKWRNALQVAERGGIEVDIRQDARDLDWLLGHYEAHRKDRRYAGPSAEFVRAMVQAGPAFLILRASVGSQPVAGILLIRHGASATYYVGWTAPEGRRVNAHNLLLWRGVLALRDSGALWLDMGGINAAAPGVARFKVGVGGAFYTLSGTYL